MSILGPFLTRNAPRRQQIHEQDECPKRLIPCERRCGEFVAADKLEHHMQCLCIKRPFPPIRCRLGCGELFAGGAHEILKCEEDRLEHEQEMCPRRMVRCHVKGCAATVRAMDRPRHRRLHMLRGGIALHCVPGAYEYKVAMGLRQLKVQKVATFLKDKSMLPMSENASKPMICFER